MSWILMDPADDDASVKAIVHIAHDTEYINVSEDHCDSNQCFTEPRVVAVTTDQRTTLSSVWGPNAILDPAFPAVEPLLASKQGALVIGLEFLSEMAHKDGMLYPKQL